MLRSVHLLALSCPCCRAARTAYGAAVACTLMSGAARAPEHAPPLLQGVVLSYPHDAEGAHDDVVVRVTISADGDVVDAEWVEGLEVFRAEALRAARKLRFVPATRDGDPVGAAVLGAAWCGGRLTWPR